MEENRLTSFEPDDGSQLNPWFSIWIYPRRTMRQILNKDNHGHVIGLAAIGGVVEALGQVGGRGSIADSSLLYILVTAIIGGLIGGVVRIYIGSGLLKWTGKWLGGKASYDEILAANAWANVPAIWTLIPWSFAILILGKGVFFNETAFFYESFMLKGFSLIFDMIILMVGIWSVFVMIKCLAEAQGFSSWRALGNYILSILVIIIPLFIVGLMISLRL